jgi:uncharacterized protein YegL
LADVLEELLGEPKMETSKRFPFLSRMFTICEEQKIFSGLVCASSMSLGMGGRMKQEIYEDETRPDAWDISETRRCFIHLCDAVSWRKITGENPPIVPMTVENYIDNGYPWFDYYRDDLAVLEGSKTLAALKSVVTIAKEKADVEKSKFASGIFKVTGPFAEKRNFQKSPKEHTVHNLIILDESSSMSSIKEQIISGFNELVQTIQGAADRYPEQSHYISFVSFNSHGSKLHHFVDPAKELKALNASTYRPHGNTPLYDTIASSFQKLRKFLRGKSAYSVLVTILTDGEENDSKSYTGLQIKNMINELKKQNWTFTYIGTDHDIDKVADTLAINSRLSFKRSGTGISEMFETERRSRERHFSELHEAVIMNAPISSNEDYFAEPDSAKK